MGAASYNEELSYVTKMGLIITVLTLPVWLLGLRKIGKRSDWQHAWAAIWRTALILCLYAAAVLIRKQFWQPSQGDSDYAIFLPIVGKLNSHFFDEYDWLAFVFELMPMAAFASGLLAFVQSQFLRPTPPT